MEISLRIIVEAPVAGVAHALQKGGGNDYEVVQTQIAAADSLHFTFEATVKDKDGVPNFTGPFVHGTNPNKFVYIDIGASAGQHTSPWRRRLKIPLTGITLDMVNKVAASSSLVLQTTVPGTGKDGGPNCATVKPFDGWETI